VEGTFLRFLAAFGLRKSARFFVEYMGAP